MIAEYECKIAALEKKIQELQDEIEIAKGLFGSIGLRWEAKVTRTAEFDGKPCTVSSIPGLSGGGGGAERLVFKP